MAKFSLNRAIHFVFAALLLGGVAFGATKKSSSKTTSKKPASRTASKPAAKPTPAPPPLAPGELPLVARSAIVLDSKTGDILYEKNPDELEYPASATKILTALLVIENGELEKPVTIQVEDTRVEPSALEFKPGEQYP